MPLYLLPFFDVTYFTAPSLFFFAAPYALAVFCSSPTACRRHFPEDATIFYAAMISSFLRRRLMHVLLAFSYMLSCAIAPAACAEEMLSSPDSCRTRRHDAEIDAYRL